MKSIYSISIFVFALTCGGSSSGKGQELTDQLTFSRSLALPSTLMQYPDQIGLSDRQLDSVRQICRRTSQQAIEIRDQVDQLSQQLFKLLEFEQLEQDSVLRTLDELHRIEGENKRLRLKALVQINNLLQLEQRNQALRIQSKRLVRDENDETVVNGKRNPETKARLKSKLATVRSKLKHRQRDDAANTLQSKLSEFRRLMRAGQIQDAEDLLDGLLESLHSQPDDSEEREEGRVPLGKSNRNLTSTGTTWEVRPKKVGESTNFYVAMQDGCASDTTNLPWITEQSNAPGVEFHLYESAAAGTTVSFHIFTPAAYTRNPDQRFPVLYWLHGTLGGIDGIPGVTQHFNGAIENGAIPPMLIVMVNGLPCRLWSNSKDGASPVESAFVEDLIPYVDANFRTRPNRAYRLLEGFSMGGFGAGRLGIKHSNLFSRVSMLSAGPLDPEFMGPLAKSNPELRQEILDIVCNGDLGCFASLTPTGTFAVYRDKLSATTMRFRQVIGELEGSLPCNEEFHRLLVEGGFPHDWIVVPNTDHNPLQILQFLMDSDGDFYNTLLPGDTNEDGNVNLLDVAPFVNVLGNGGYIPEADMNGDGAVNLLDVSLFVQALVG